MSFTKGLSDLWDSYANNRGFNGSQVSYTGLTPKI